MSKAVRMSGLAFVTSVPLRPVKRRARRAASPSPHPRPRRRASGGQGERGRVSEAPHDVCGTK